MPLEKQLYKEQESNISEEASLKIIQKIQEIFNAIIQN